MEAGDFTLPVPAGSSTWQELLIGHMSELMNELRINTWLDMDRLLNIYMSYFSYL